jgi:hypothetical protein
MSASATPSTSATMAASTESDPWPISDWPQKTATPPERSSFSITPDCGMWFQ